MTVKTENGFRLSMSGAARQVVLLCHGRWTPPLYKKSGKVESEGDGYVPVPKGTVVHFYTPHGTFTKGSATAEEILKDQSNSYGGLKQPGVKGDFSVQCHESQGSGLKIYNYSLYEDDRTAAKGLWQTHEAGKYGKDVDLLIVSPEKSKNLSDAFKACKKMHGSYYPVLHFCPCRFVEEVQG